MLTHSCRDGKQEGLCGGKEKETRKRRQHNERMNAGYETSPTVYAHVIEEEKEKKREKNFLFSCRPRKRTETQGRRGKVKRDLASGTQTRTYSLSLTLAL